MTYELHLQPSAEALQYGECCNYQVEGHFSGLAMGWSMESECISIFHAHNRELIQLPHILAQSL
jgi:hypothetical protein